MSNSNFNNNSDKIEYDIVLVGGSPSNLALAHKLVDLASQSGKSFTMAILEKSKEFGGHIISGAVSNPHVIKQLFPDYKTSGFPIEAVCEESYLSLLGSQKKWDIPSFLLPPGMKKEGYFVLSLSKVVSWMANSLKEKLKVSPNIQIDFFTGFAAHKILIEGTKPENSKVVGVCVAEEAGRVPADENIYAKLTCFGDKGFLSRDLIDKFKLRDNPQIWSVGVKEVWQLDSHKDYAGKVWHTLGSPVTDGTFGGGFVYGMKDHQLTIGLVISLDSQNPNINPQQRLQDLKKHPWIQEMIAGGKLLNYGAAVLPEGGFYSLPNKFAVDGALLMGDALGVLDINSLAGIDKAMECGIQAAELIHNNLENKVFGESQLAPYKSAVINSHVGESLWKGRYFRYAFQENPRLLTSYLPLILKAVDEANPFAGFLDVKWNFPFQAPFDALKMGLALSGLFNLGEVKYKPDHKHIEPDFHGKHVLKTNLNHDPDTIYSREDAVFFAHTKYHEGNRHIDEFNAETCIKCISKYDALFKETPCVSDCTAEVHRIDLLAVGDKNAPKKLTVRTHAMSLENCVQCRTCEIVCPEVNLRVNATSQGAGPDFMGL